MGNIIDYCSQLINPIKIKEVLIKEEPEIKNLENNQLNEALKNNNKEEALAINSIENQNKHLLSKNKQESIHPSNIENSISNNAILKKGIEETSEIIIDNSNNIKNNIASNQKIETPDGINIIQAKIDSPKKAESKVKIQINNKNKIKKNVSPPKTILAPIPENNSPISKYDKSTLPGHLILNFKAIVQLDKITEIENAIGGEFSLDINEISKYENEYPYKPKKFSIKYPSGEIYSGFFSPNWVKEVFGIQIDKNGNKYVGMFKNGMFEGKGRLILHKGDYYEGEFIQNKANGQGKYVNSNGEIYNGHWIDDKQDGEGELILKDGSIYFGEFKNGKKNGKGRITWSDNSFYEGDFVNNNYEGHGVYIINNKGKGYIGEWKEGKMNGFGVFFWADGRKYKGYYENDKKNGYGIYSGKNNLRYEGKFKKGKQHGLGRITDNKGEKQYGLYIKGKKLKYLNENDFKEDIQNLDIEIEKINNIFNTNEFFIKNKELMNFTLGQK